MNTAGPHPVEIESHHHILNGIRIEHDGVFSRINEYGFNPHLGFADGFRTKINYGDISYFPTRLM